MPKSLINASYAADIMKYILKDDEYDTIIGGSDIEIRTRLIQWWKNWIQRQLPFIMRL